LIAAVVLLLIGGTTVPSYLAIVARIERNRADEKAAEALAAQQRVGDKAAEARRERDEARRQAERADWQLYLNQIASAHREWQTNNAAAAWGYLNACRRDLRGWEHDYLYTLFTSGQTAFKGHANSVTSVAFSPDGQRIVSGSHDETVRVWDTATGQEMLTLKHSMYACSVAFSPDGKRIASASGDMALRVWNAATGQESLTLKGHISWPYAVAFSPDGKRIVSGSLDGTLNVWDSATGREIWTLKGHGGKLWSVAFSSVCWSSEILRERLSTLIAGRVCQTNVRNARRPTQRNAICQLPRVNSTDARARPTDVRDQTRQRSSFYSHGAGPSLY